MMMKLRETRGFTLVELLVALGLLGLVVSGAFTLYYYTDRAFSVGTRNADAQAEMQNAMHRVTEFLRLSRSLTVETQLNPTTAGEKGENYVIYLHKGSVRLRYPNGADVALLDRDTAAEPFQISFQRVDGVSRLLSVHLGVNGSNLEYSLESDVELLNLDANGIKGQASGTAVVFRTDFTPEDEDIAQRIRPGCILFSRAYSPGAPQLYALRQFRDNYLATNPLGRLVIKTYYTLSDAALALLEVAPWAEVPVSTAFKGVAELILLFV